MNLGNIMQRLYTVTGTLSVRDSVVLEVTAHRSSGIRSYHCELDEPISGIFDDDGKAKVVIFACDVSGGDKIWLDSKSEQFIRKPGRPRSSWGPRDPATKKATLLEMARSIQKRPSNRSKDEIERSLGAALNNYTCKTNAGYDADFDELIRAIMPEWFRLPKQEYYAYLMKITKKPRNKVSCNAAK
jgi:hypothetical protein